MKRDELKYIIKQVIKESFINVRMEPLESNLPKFIHELKINLEKIKKDIENPRKKQQALMSLSMMLDKLTALDQTSTEFKQNYRAPLPITMDE
jgi:hypothetical protein